MPPSTASCGIPRASPGQRSEDLESGGAIVNTYGRPSQPAPLAVAASAPSRPLPSYPRADCDLFHVSLVSWVHVRGYRVARGLISEPGSPPQTLRSSTATHNVRNVVNKLRASSCRECNLYNNQCGPYTPHKMAGSAWPGWVNTPRSEVERDPGTADDSGNT